MERMKLAVDELSASLTDRLSEIRMWDKDTVKPIIAAYLLSAIKDCYNAEISNAEDTLSKLRQSLAIEKVHYKRKELESQIAAAKVQKKHCNRIFHEAEHLNLYGVMRAWVKSQFGHKTLKEFDTWFKTQNSHMSPAEIS